MIFGADFVLVLGLKFRTKVQEYPVAVWGRMCGLSMTCLWLGSGAILCPGGGLFMLSVMAVCVDCFVGISYTITGLENQVVFACF